MIKGMHDFFQFDSDAMGSKGLVFVGERLLVYRRDTNTDVYPLCIDLPGGRPENNETPFETFAREVHEEFGLTINKEDIETAHRYASIAKEGKFAWFPVVRLPKEVEKNIVFGDEGVGYMLMSVNDFLDVKDVWPMLQERAKDYLQTLKGA